MKNVLIINGHQPYSFAQGQLNQSLVERATRQLTDKGYAIQRTQVADGWDVEEEIAKHQWADVIILQMPVNWMGVSWPLKKYMDEVYTAGMDGRLCAGDGRYRQDPSRQYGSGGTLTEVRYMLSLTFNAPREAFDNPVQTFFGGKSVDDLMWPMHLNFKFFGMQPLPTFAAHDVMKNPQIEKDFARFEAHLDEYFAPVAAETLRIAA